MSKTERATSTRATGAASSPSSSRTAIGSPPATAASTSGCRCRCAIVGLTVPAGGYDYATGRVSYTFGQQRRVSGTATLESGEFYDGDKTTLTISQGRLNLSPQLSIEPTYAGNWVTLPDSRSTTHLAGTRVTYTVTPTMFASALVQYNTGVNAVSANVRLRWEYRPGSELFVVFNEQRDTLTREISRSDEPRGHRQGESPAPILTPSWSGAGDRPPAPIYSALGGVAARRLPMMRFTSRLSPSWPCVRPPRPRARPQGVLVVETTTINGTPRTSQVQIEPNRIRTEVAGPDGASQVVIFDGAKQVLYMVESGVEDLQHDDQGRRGCRRRADRQRDGADAEGARRDAAGAARADGSDDEGAGHAGHGHARQDRVPPRRHVEGVEVDAATSTKASRTTQKTGEVCTVSPSALGFTAGRLRSVAAARRISSAA